MMNKNYIDYISELYKNLFEVILDKYGEKEMVRFIKKKMIPNQKLWDDKKKWHLLVRKYMEYYKLKM